MELKVEYDDSLPDDLTILRTKSHHSYVDKVSQLFEDPFPSNMIITQEGSSFSPIELNQIHFFFTENKAVYANTESGKQKVQEGSMKLKLVFLTISYGSQGLRLSICNG